MQYAVRQERAAAGPEHGPDGEADVEQRENQGDPGHHIGIVGPADKEGIGQVVDQDNDLAHDGGECHGAHTFLRLNTEGERKSD